MIPEELKELPNWIFWEYRPPEKPGGKRRKVPMNPHTGFNGSSTAPDKWGMYQEAVDACKKYKGNGIGFVFTNSPYIGLDFDECMNGSSITPEAIALLERVDSYAEFSPSGTGLHIIAKGELPEKHKCKFLNVPGMKELEIYHTARFFTFTGKVIPGYECVYDRGEVVTAILNEHTEPEEPKKEAPPPATSTRPDVDMSTTAIIERIRNSKQGLKFSRLFDDGDISAYGDNDSVADEALMGMLPFWCGGDRGLMEAIFSQSALGRRDKWQQRADYRNRTIEAAFKVWDGTIYTTPQERRKQRLAEKFGTTSTDDTDALTPEQEKKLAFLSATDTGNAERLQIVTGDKIKYLTEKGRGAAWYVWRGKTWEPSYENELYNIVTEAMKIAHDATSKYAKDDNYKDDRDMLEAIQLWLAKSINQNRIDATLKRARGMFNARITDFDQDDFLLNVQNGIVDLKTGELLPHDKTFMCSKIARAEYRPELRNFPSLWTQTLEAIIPDEQERRYLQKWSGYLLSGSCREEKLLFIYGPGGSGKGSYINTIAYAMGDYSETIDIEIFLSSRNDANPGGSGATPEIAKLAGCRAAIGSESGVGRKLNDAKLKNLSGRDDVTARFLYGQQFTFTPSMKFVLQSNYLPSVHDSTDSGIGRRLVIAPFMENFEGRRDTTLKDRLREPDNLAAVLTWCVEGCQMWLEEGLGEEPERYKQEERKFYADSDSLEQFIADECSIKPVLADSKFMNTRWTGRAAVKAFHHRYQNWLGEKIKRKSLVELMARKGYQTHKFTEGQCFLGVELKPGNIYDNSASGYPY